MAKDERLYMTFPNDLHRHPKLERLPVEARWAFIEMNGEARIADNDGRFASEDAEFLWSTEILDALLNSHPTRPLVLRDGADYVIREYAKHQQTKADREALSAKRADAGRKGGLAKAQANASKSQADGGKQKHSQSQSQSHQTSTHVSESQSLDNRASESTDSVSEPYRSIVASQAGITSVEEIRDYLEDRTGVRLSCESTVAVSMWLIGKSKKPVERPMRYLRTCVDGSSEEIKKHIYDSALT